MAWEKFKHQTFSILTTEVLHAITEAIAEVILCTIKGKEYSAFKRHPLTLQYTLLKYNKTNSCKSIYHFFIQNW